METNLKQRKYIALPKWQMTVLLIILLLLTLSFMTNVIFTIFYDPVPITNHLINNKMNVQEDNVKKSEDEQAEITIDDNGEVRNMHIFPPDPVPISIPEYFTIFIGIYSFRNSFCSDTIKSLLLNASNLEILSIGIYEEHDKNDINELKYCTGYKQHCNEYQIRYDKHHAETPNSAKLKLLSSTSSRDKQRKALRKQRKRRDKIKKKKIEQEIIETEHESKGTLSDSEILYFQKICKFEQIKIKSMPWDLSKGESFARSEVYRLFYDQQTFILNIDANFKFIKNWDIQLMKQWASTQNEFAILSTYPPHDIDDNNDEYINVLCSKNFMDWSWRHMLQNHVSTIESKHIFAPTLQPFLSSSFYFVKAHFLIFVEYDPYFDSMMDNMIEFDLEMRGFTNGYDFYAPSMNVLYSMVDYKEKKKNEKENYRKLYRSTWKEKSEKAIKSTHRLRLKTKLEKYIEQDAECKENVDEMDLELYGLGDIRSLNDYLEFTGIDLISHTLDNDKCVQLREYKLERIGVLNKWTVHDIHLLQKYLEA